MEHGRVNLHGHTAQVAVVVFDDVLVFGAVKPRPQTLLGLRLEPYVALCWIDTRGDNCCPHVNEKHKSRYLFPLNVKERVKQLFRVEGGWGRLKVGYE